MDDVDRDLPAKRFALYKDFELEYRFLLHENWIGWVHNLTEKITKLFILHQIKREQLEKANRKRRK